VQYKAQIDLLVGLGKVIISITAQQPSDTPQSPLEEDLTSVRTRYDEVWKRLETRNVTLETTVSQMEKYRRLVRNITIFLGRTEKRLGTLEPVGGDTDTISRQISEHKVRFGLTFKRSIVRQSRQYVSTQTEKEANKQTDSHGTHTERHKQAGRQAGGQTDRQRQISRKIF